MNDAAPGADGPLRQAVRRKARWTQALAAVGAAFFGVRKSTDHARDADRIDPLHVVVAGVLGAALFVVILVLVVGWVVDSGVAR